MAEKYCPKCKQTKDIFEFNVRRARKDGLSEYCKECTNVERRQHYARRHALAFDYPMHKTCRYCDDTKPYTEFPKNPIYKDGLDPMCTACAVRKNNHLHTKRILENGFIKITEKECVCCKTVKPTSCFWVDRHSPNGFNRLCKECETEKKKQWRVRNADKIRRGKLKAHHGITDTQYYEMLKSQNGVCAICGQQEFSRNRHGEPMPLFVDHNHKTGQIRQLLCSKCNSAIGMVNDDPEILIRAAEYLRKHQPVNVQNATTL